MNTIYCYLISFLILILIYGISKIFKSNKTIRVIAVFLSILYILLIQLRYCMPDSFVFVVNSPTGYANFDDQTIISSKDILQSILRWGLSVCSIVNASALYTDNKLFKNISIFLCLPIAIVSALYFDRFIYYFLGKENGLMVTHNILNTKIHFPNFIVCGEFFLEIGLSITMPLFILFIEKYNPIKEIKKIDLIKVAIFIIPIILISTPMFVPQSLIGYTSFKIGPFSLNEGIYMLSASTICFALYYAYRNSDYKTRYSICFALAVAAVHFYTQMFVLGHQLNRIAFFQLCNLGNFLYLICIIFRSQKLFDFCFTANVLGAIIAFCVPDFNAGFFEPWNFHFFLDHTLLLFLPILFYGLGIFKKPNKKSFKHIIIIYSVFFLSCFIAGLLLNVRQSNIEHWNTNAVNYFYMFDVNKITSKAKILKPIGALKIQIGSYYQLSYLWVILQYFAYLFGIYLIFLFNNFLIGIGEEHIRLSNSIVERKIKENKKTIRQFFNREEMEEYKHA